MRLSLVIPAFNEARRLPPYLSAIRPYLSRSDLNYEVIVVDDGSFDGTAKELERTHAEWAELRILRHAINRGRGEAIRTGHGAARGELVLYADADGATPIAEEAKLRAAIDAGADIAIGGRLGSEVSRHSAREAIGIAFRHIVRALVPVPVRDTQCGFKMWRREAGTVILGACRETHWLLDLEFLAIADRLAFCIAEVPVAWHEVNGSKVKIARDSWRMFRGLWSIRRRLRCFDQSRTPPAPTMVGRTR